MQMLMGHCLMIMPVVFAVLAVNMDMGMRMRMLMGMDSRSVAVLVGMGMIMLMGVLQFYGVLDHKICAEDHDCQSRIELDRGSFAQNQHAKSYAQERGNGIVGTCLGCTQIFLRHDIEIDA